MDETEVTPMNLPLQITFRNMAPSEAVERRIWKHIEGLGKFSDRIMGCRVVVEARHHKHHQGNLFHIRIDMTVPGDEIVVSREPALHHTHEDVYVAFRDAFDAVRRRLEDYEGWQATGQDARGSAARPNRIRGLRERIRLHRDG